MLLGNVSSSGVIEVTNSFGVFHKKREGDVLVRTKVVNDLLGLHKQANDKEAVVGWYSTYSNAQEEALGDFTLAVHSFFADIPSVSAPA
jgi:hypothetical protein